MKITDFAVEKRAGVFILIVIIIIMGSISYLTLPREGAPDIEIPIIMITTPYFGVSPSDIETLVTRPLERELKDLRNVKVMASTSAEGASMIRVEFAPQANLDESIQQVREKVNRAKIDLPEDAEEPIIQEISFSDFPILIVNLSAKYDLVLLKKVADDLQDKIEGISGVLDVSLAGGVDREIQVLINPDRLAHYHLSLNDIILAIRSENINIPGGNIEMGNSSYLIRVPGEFEDINLLEQVVIKAKFRKPIYIKDVGRVIDTYRERTSYSRLNRQNSVSLSITKRTGVNLIKLCDNIKTLVKTLQTDLPTGTSITFMGDFSEHIRNIVAELENSILSGLLLVLIVIFFALGLRSAIIVALAIPFSMLIAFATLDLMGITLNMVVLFSLILALGMLVDNAIVVVENIYRHYHLEKIGRLEAAIKGTSEVAWPITTSTITTLCAFMPLIFWPGIMGKFMSFLPKTLMLTLAASLFIALVINPVLTAVFIKRSNSKSKPEKKHSSEENSDIKPGSGFMSLYRRFLTLCLKYRLLTMLAVFGFVILTMLIYVKFQHGVEFFPVTTPESVMVSIKAPDGIKLDVTDALAARVEKCMSANKNIEIFVANTGVGGAGSGSTLPHRARINADFQEREKWLENPNLTIEKLRKCIDKLAGAELKIDRDKMGPPSGRPVNIEISGPDFNILSKLSQQVMEKIKGVKGLVDLSRDYNRGRPELLIRVRREEAKIVGTNTMKVAREIRTAINGSKASVFREGNDEYDIVVKLDRQFQDDYLELKRLTVPGKDGVPVPLTEVAQLTTASGSGSIRHKDTRRVVTISADVEERLPNQVLKEIKTILATFNLPAKYNLAFTGQKEEENNAKAFLKKAFLIAVLLISLVLVVQFNSILIPLVILSSVLLSIMGVLWGLLLTITPFGVMMTGMGIISLAGVVVNNAIVLIDFIIKLREKGVKKIEAIVLAGMVRLRPVLLTAITTILGLIPMATGIGIDFHQMTLQIGGRSGEWWKPMAVTVIFGLAVATVLTLVVVPVMYSLFDSLSNHFKKLVASEEDI